jgi:hypothetical protein
LPEQEIFYQECWNGSVRHALSSCIPNARL